MKRTITLLVVVLQAALATAQDSRPNYAVAIGRFRKFYNEKQADSVYAMFSPRMQAAMPVPKIKEMFDALHTQIGKLNSTRVDKETGATINYRGSFEKTELSILFTLNNENQLNGLFFVPVKEEDPSAPKDTSNFKVLNNKGDRMYGSLVMPANIHIRSNVVLIIAGSGPTDRNCNSTMGVKSDAYKILADSLRKAGIASVRYDKRGVGESVGAHMSEQDTRFDDMVDDAVLFIKRIKDDGRFAKIYILGHSEGSLVGMLAAQKEPVDGFISLAGPGEAADVALERQIKAGMPGKEKEAVRILRQLEKGKTVETEDEQLKAIFRPSVQPYLISWFAYDPRAEIKKLNIPVLILQGTTDVQVQVKDAQLLKKAQPAAKLVLIDRMNHVLKTAGEDRTENIATYNNPDLPLAKGLSDAIVEFCAAK